MKKIHLLAVALCAVFALSAVTAASASAAQWLVEGKEVTSAIKVQTEGELELIHLAGGFLEPQAIILCSGIFDGVIEAAGKDRIETLLTLGGVEVNSTKPVACTHVETCETGSEVYAENLPWNTQLEEMAGGVFLDLFSSSGSGNPAYQIDCLVGGVKDEILCEGETSAVLALNAGGELEGTFTAEELELENLEGKCGTHEKVALQNGKGITLLEGSTEKIEVSP